MKIRLISDNSVKTNVTDAQFDKLQRFNPVLWESDEQPQPARTREIFKSEETKAPIEPGTTETN